MSSTTTRDRIIDAAMRLFSEHGYAATSIAQIEAAAEIEPHAGGLHHHFESKEAVLGAGIECRLQHLEEMSDIGRVLSPIGDHVTELTLIACYILAELESESELMLILAAEAPSRPALLRAAVEQLIDFTFTSFVAWIGERAQRPIPDAQTSAIAALGFGSLLSSHLLCQTLGAGTRVENEALLDTWIGLMASALTEG